MKKLLVALGFLVAAIAAPVGAQTGAVVTGKAPGMVGVAQLKKGGGMVVARTEQKGAVGSKPGERPAGAVGRQVTVVADVTAVDPATQMVTLKGPQRTVDLKVPDPEQFKRIAKGDQVEATYTQAVAMAVEPKK